MSIPILQIYKDNNIEIRKKGDWKWYHTPVPVFFFLVGIFNPQAKEDFYERFYTMLPGALYVPEKKYDDLLKLPWLHMATLRHELVHDRDYKEGKIKYLLGYAFVKKMRAYFERRGYTQNMIVEFERTGAISNRTVDFIVRQFTGPTYFHMDKDAAVKIEEIRLLILDGTYSGMYPEVK